MNHAITLLDPTFSNRSGRKKVTFSSVMSGSLLRNARLEDIGSRGESVYIRVDIK